MKNEMQSRPGSARSRGGFTFLELLVSITIIAILSGVVGLGVYKYIKEARVTTAKQQIQILKSAIIGYAAEQGAIPKQEQGLEALVHKTTVPPIPEKFPEGGYLDSPRVPLDPWKHPYIYLAPGHNNEPFEIISYGGDGEPGGSGDAADISSSNLQ
jgi:general secretion pathway protein G